MHVALHAIGDRTACKRPLRGGTALFLRSNSCQVWAPTQRSNEVAGVVPAWLQPWARVEQQVQQRPAMSEAPQRLSHLVGRRVALQALPLRVGAESRGATLPFTRMWPAAVNCCRRQQQMSQHCAGRCAGKPGAVIARTQQRAVLQPPPLPFGLTGSLRAAGAPVHRPLPPPHRAA